MKRSRDYVLLTVLILMPLVACAESVESTQENTAAVLVCPSGSCQPGGYLLGGRTDYYDLGSSQFLTFRSWGRTSLNSAYAFMGRWKGAIEGFGEGASYTYFYFTPDPAGGGYSIIGGEQVFWPDGNPTTFAIEHAWGSHQGFAIDLGIDTVAYHPPWGWGLSRTIAFAVSSDASNPDNGYNIDGAMNLSRDLESRHENVLVSAYGNFTPNFENRTDIAVGQSWTPTYGWGFSTYGLSLVKPCSGNSSWRCQ